MTNSNVVPIDHSNRQRSTSDPYELAELIANELAHIRAAARRIRDIAGGSHLPRHAVELDALGTNVEGITERIYARIFQEPMPELPNPRRRP